MSKIIGFLFPWWNTYRRLELQKRWWHRLAVVLFFIALVPALLFSWGIADDGSAPTNQFDSDITYWERTTSGTLLSYDPSSPPPVDLSSLGAVPQAPANIPPSAFRLYHCANAHRSKDDTDAEWRDRDVSGDYA